MTRTRDRITKGKPLHELRCLAWREGAEKAEVVSKGQVKLGKLKPGSTLKDQIKLVLRAQQARVMDLFRCVPT